MSDLNPHLLESWLLGGALASAAVLLLLVFLIVDPDGWWD